MLGWTFARAHASSAAVAVKTLHSAAEQPVRLTESLAGHLSAFVSQYHLSTGFVVNKTSCGMAYLVLLQESADGDIANKEKQEDNSLRCGQFDNWIAHYAWRDLGICKWWADWGIPLTTCLLLPFQIR